MDNSSAEAEKGGKLPKQERGRARGLQSEVASEAARVLTRALSQVESMLDRAEGRSPSPPSPSSTHEELPPPDPNELRRSLRRALDRLEDAIDHVGIEEQRLSDQVAELALLIERLEHRLDGVARQLERSLARLAPAAQEVTAEPAPVRQEPREPRFAAGGEGVGLVIADVPGFQGLMEVQWGLTRLPAVQSASVKRYQNGEASIKVLLREPATASEIVEGVSDATGNTLLIEEARPDTSRLRLRFIRVTG
jgi:hypothetical protein